LRKCASLSDEVSILEKLQYCGNGRQRSAAFCSNHKKLALDYVKIMNLVLILKFFSKKA